MGYTLRTGRWRYTEWRVWINGIIADWTPKGLNSTELYDHLNDDGSSFDDYEYVNVAAQNAEIIPHLSNALR